MLRGYEKNAKAIGRRYYRNGEKYTKELQGNTKELERAILTKWEGHTPASTGK